MVERAKAEEFWNDLVEKYDYIIPRLVSPYPTMQWGIFYYLPDGFNPKRILELGCGTGNMTKTIHEKFPKAEITVVDAAPMMLEAAKAKVPDATIHTIDSTFQALELEPEHYDLVISSLAIHHLTDEEKPGFFQQIYNWIAPGGFFVYADCVRGESDRLYELNNKEWIKMAIEHGLTDEEVHEQIDHHHKHDHYPVLIQVVDWFRDCGFKNVDILWRYCIWAIVQAEKPTN